MKIEVWVLVKKDNSGDFYETDNFKNLPTWRSKDKLDELVSEYNITNYEPRKATLTVEESES